MPGDEQSFKTSEPSKEDQNVAASGSPELCSLNGATLEDDAIFQQFEDVTSAAAKAAKDYRSWMFEYIKGNVCVALDYANRLASVTDLVVHSGTRDKIYSQTAHEIAPAVAKVAGEYWAKTFELLMATNSTTFAYTQRLANVKTPAEFVELSTSLARKHLEFIVEQTAEFGSIAQR